MASSLDGAIPAMPVVARPSVGPGPRICLAGAAIFAIGSALPWTRVEVHIDPQGAPVPFDPVTITHGINLLTVGAMIVIPLAVVLAVASLTGGHRLRGGWITVAIGSAVTLAAQAVAVLDPVGRVIADMIDQGVPATEARAAFDQGVLSVEAAGLGGWTVMAGTAVVIVGAVAAILRGPRKVREPEAPPVDVAMPPPPV